MYIILIAIRTEQKTGRRTSGSFQAYNSHLLTAALSLKMDRLLLSNFYERPENVRRLRSVHRNNEWRTLRS
jgi:hypothetical protein